MPSAPATSFLYLSLATTFYTQSADEEVKVWKESLPQKIWVSVGSA